MPARDSSNGPVRPAGAVGLLLVLLIPLMLLGLLFVHHQLDRSMRVQLAVERAERQTSELLVLQLDEETGLRGFISTGRRGLFLEPYVRAVKRFDPAVKALKSALGEAGADGVITVVDRVEAANDAWQETVASPLLSGNVAPASSLQVRGKYLVDGIRSDVAVIRAALAQTGRESAARTSSTIELTLWLGVLVVAGIGLAGWLYVRQRTKIDRRLAEQQQSLAIAHQAYATEKRIADTLRDAFLVQSLPVLPSLGFHAQYVPSSVEAKVGGDWYDAFDLADGRVFFSIGDVAGHGIDAAVAMNRARQSIIAAALHENDPGTVLTRANATIVAQESPMVTALCGYIEPRTGGIRYAGAGHPPPILASAAGEVSTLPPGGIPLGIIENATFETVEAVAAPSAVLVLYTDGVSEHGRDLVEGERRLLETVSEVAASRAADPASAIREAIFRTAPPTDDVAILTVTFRGAPVAPDVVGAVRPQSGRPA